MSKIPAILLVLIITSLMILPPTSGRWYIFSVNNSSWTTGIRESRTVGFGLSGFSVGNGSYGRYCEISLSDVKVRDRTSSADGTLDFREYLAAESDAEGTIVMILYKNPGNQAYYFLVNETWPSHIKAARTLDFSGRRINDLEYFGNNFEYAGSHYLYATDLRKDTYADMNLSDTRFYAVINDTLSLLLLDAFAPNMTMQYNHRSSFTGLATLKFRHSQDRKPAALGDDTYWGSFRVTRSMNTTSFNVRPCDDKTYYDNETVCDYRFKDLGCCCDREEINIGL